MCIVLQRLDVQPETCAQRQFTVQTLQMVKVRTRNRRINKIDCAGHVRTIKTASHVDTLYIFYMANYPNNQGI